MGDNQLEGAIWVGAKVLTAEIDIDRVLGSALLPNGIELETSGKATVFVADYPQTTFGSIYREAAVILHCTDSKGPLRHCPWMVVDDDTALILGRELLGFPKKMADISLVEDGSRVKGTVSRKGADLIDLEGVVGESIKTPKPLFAHRMVNLFGSIIGGMKLLELASATELIHDARSVDLKVVMGSSDKDQIGVEACSIETKGQLLLMDFGGPNGAVPELTSDVDETWSAGRFFSRAL
ncbi:MAG: hypothetical protein HKL80_00845 [Acidimicrobiales bacterium]|nr:hypothetical protein [Acidimicrobiales bacterium]